MRSVGVIPSALDLCVKNCSRMPLSDFARALVRSALDSCVDKGNHVPLSDFVRAVLRQFKERADWDVHDKVDSKTCVVCPACFTGSRAVVALQILWFVD